MTLAGGNDWENPPFGPQHSRGNGNQNVGDREFGGTGRDGHTSKMTVFQGAHNFVVNQAGNTPLVRNIKGNYYYVQNIIQPSDPSSDSTPELSQQDVHTPGSDDYTDGYEDNVEYNANPQFEDDPQSRERLPQDIPFWPSVGRDERLGDINFNGAHNFRQIGEEFYSLDGRHRLNTGLDTTTVTPGPPPHTRHNTRHEQQHRQRSQRTEREAPSRAREADSNSRQVQSPERAPQIHKRSANPRTGASNYNGACNFILNDVDFAHVGGNVINHTALPVSSLQGRQRRQRSDFTSQQSPPPTTPIPIRRSHHYNAASRASRLSEQGSQYFERVPRSSPTPSTAPQNSQAEHRNQINEHENSESTSRKSHTSFPVPQHIQEESKVPSLAIFPEPQHFQDKKIDHLLNFPERLQHSGTPNKVRFSAQQRVESTSQSAPVVPPVPQRTTISQSSPVVPPVPQHTSTSQSTPVVLPVPQRTQEAPVSLRKRLGMWKRKISPNI